MRLIRSFWKIVLGIFLCLLLVNLFLINQYLNKKGFSFSFDLKNGKYIFIAGNTQAPPDDKNVTVFGAIHDINNEELSFFNFEKQEIEKFKLSPSLKVYKVPQINKSKIKILFLKRINFEELKRGDSINLVHEKNNPGVAFMILKL